MLADSFFLHILHILEVTDATCSIGSGWITHDTNLTDGHDPILKEAVKQFFRKSTDMTALQFLPAYVVFIKHHHNGSFPITGMTTAGSDREAFQNLNLRKCCIQFLKTAAANDTHMWVLF